MKSTDPGASLHCLICKMGIIITACLVGWSWRVNEWVVKHLEQNVPQSTRCLDKTIQHFIYHQKATTNYAQVRLEGGTGPQQEAHLGQYQHPTLLVPAPRWDGHQPVPSPCPLQLLPPQHTCLLSPLPGTSTQSSQLSCRPQALPPNPLPQTPGSDSNILILEYYILIASITWILKQLESSAKIKNNFA